MDHQWEPQFKALVDYCKSTADRVASLPDFLSIAQPKYQELDDDKLIALQQRQLRGAQAQLQRPGGLAGQKRDSVLKAMVDVLLELRRREARKQDTNTSAAVSQDGRLCAPWW